MGAPQDNKTQRKTGADIQKSLKGEILTFGKNMRKSSGRSIMPRQDLMVKTANLTKQENQKSSQICL